MGGGFLLKHISVASFVYYHGIILIVSVAHNGCRIPGLGICVSSRGEKEKGCGLGVAQGGGCLPQKHKIPNTTQAGSGEILLLLGVIVSFCQLDTNRDIPGKKNSQLRESLPKTGLLVCL